ncbi:hypothetical protein B2M27_24020 [Kluyvera intermedia]|uniref:Uncharacterized protein n=1 Tax=Kluyvera intermedia TaxID=61648 RepID=A0ABX3U8G3_KLUIN|nr:hypothetical protein [Kluyvera intermedia]ORJ47821.1 hypothetical protein B2M27_24020 [Kluyvera intermedia]
MNYEMTTKQLLDAAEPASRYVPTATAELITGLANAVRQLTGRNFIGIDRDPHSYSTVCGRNYADEEICVA